MRATAKSLAPVPPATVPPWYIDGGACLPADPRDRLVYMMGWLEVVAKEYDVPDGYGLLLPSLAMKYFDLYELSQYDPDDQDMTQKRRAEQGLLSELRALHMLPSNIHTGRRRELVVDGTTPDAPVLIEQEAVAAELDALLKSRKPAKAKPRKRRAKKRK